MTTTETLEIHVSSDLTSQTLTIDGNTSPLKEVTLKSDDNNVMRQITISNLSVLIQNLAVPFLLPHSTKRLVVHHAKYIERFRDRRSTTQH